MLLRFGSDKFKPPFALVPAFSDVPKLPVVFSAVFSPAFNDASKLPAVFNAVLSPVLSPELSPAFKFPPAEVAVFDDKFAFPDVLVEVFVDKFELPPAVISVLAEVAALVDKLTLPAVLSAEFAVEVIPPAVLVARLDAKFRPSDTEVPADKFAFASKLVEPYNPNSCY